MGDLPALIAQLSTWQRVLLLVLGIAIAHLVVRAIRRMGERFLVPKGERRDAALRTHPRVASTMTVVGGALTFTIYFGGIGLVLSELGLNLTAYLATASVLGLAIGFGAQGLVQDVVTGLTLIFSDVLNVGDVVDIGGQTGRVDRIGLRFTVLATALEQLVYVPNRNITQINRYRGGHVRAYLDAQIPEGADEGATLELVRRIAEGMRRQHSRLILAKPELLGPRAADEGGWRYIRVKLRVWPGQVSLVEGPLARRIAAAVRMETGADYPDWMVTVTYRAD